jgi:hypothetical protein
MVAAAVLRGYVQAMVFRLNRRVVVLLTVFFFALSGVLHGFSAAAMSADMLTMAASGAPASDEACGGYCSNDGDMSAANAGCEAVCPSLAFLGTMPASNQMSTEVHPQATPSGALSGRIGPPEPHPPKPVSLS